MADEETFEVEIDTHKPWHMREELFNALTAKTKMEIVQDWKASGMQMPTQQEIKKLPTKEQHELLRVVQGWLIWAGHKPKAGGKVKRGLRIDRNPNGKLMGAEVYEGE
jgi:hypothetical protein